MTTAPARTICWIPTWNEDRKGDGSDFRAELPVDEDGIVLDYPELFRRVQ